MEIKLSTQTKAPANTVPAHVIERMESEWRQMRDSKPQPVSASSQK